MTESSAAAFASLGDDLPPSALSNDAVNVGLHVQDSVPASHAASSSPGLSLALGAVAMAVPGTTASVQTPKKRKGGRQKDPVWAETTIVDGKQVVCNKCQAIIHRYGCTKVERVRAHFENKCIFTKRPRLMHESSNGIGTGNASVSDDSIGASLSALGNGTGAMTGNASARARGRSEYGTKLGVFKRRIAQWMFTSGHAFQEVRNAFLLNAFVPLRLDVTFPTPYELEHELLELEFNASVAKINRAMSGKACGLMLERWIDVNGQAMVNYSAFCEGNAFFMEFAPVTPLGSEFPADGVDRVLSKQKKTVVYGVLSPLAHSISRVSQEAIQKKYPQCVFFYGCVAHALRLLMSDLCSILSWMGTTYELAQQGIKTLQANPKLDNELRALQFAEGKPPLVSIEDEGSVVSVYDVMNTILKSERELVTLVSRRDFVESGRTADEQEALKRLQNFVLGDTFLQDVMSTVNMLQPFQEQLTRAREEQASLSCVYRCKLDLLAVFSCMEIVSKKDLTLISACIEDRFNSIYGDCHGVAYLLDPVFLGADMDDVKKQQVEAFIVNCCSHLLHTVGIDVLDQLHKYRTMVEQLKSCNEAYWELLVSGKVRPFDFWIERRQFPQLQQLAWIVFALPVTCTTPTHTFANATTFLHSKFHTQLPDEKLHKLAFVFCNARHLQPDVKEPESLMSMVLNDCDDPTKILL